MATTRKTSVKKTTKRAGAKGAGAKNAGTRTNGVSPSGGRRKKRKSADGAGRRQVNARATAKTFATSGQPNSESPRWTFFTNHAHVLICLWQDSTIVLRDIAQRVGITERAVQRIVQELEQAGFIERERVGRRNHYRVAKNKSLRHPIEEHCSVEELFAVILEKK